MWWQPIIGVVVGAILTFLLMRRLQKSEIKRAVRERRLLEIEEFVDEKLALVRQLLHLEDNVKKLKDRGEEITDRVSQMQKRIIEAESELAKALSKEEIQKLREELKRLKGDLESLPDKTYLEMLAEMRKYYVSPEHLKTQGKILKGYGYDRELDGLINNFLDLELSIISRGNSTSSGKEQLAQLDEYAQLIRERIDFLITKS
jgi:hypothetical protein